MAMLGEVGIRVRVMGGSGLHLKKPESVYKKLYFFFFNKLIFFLLN